MIDINTLRFEVQLNKLDNSQLVLSPSVVEDLLDRIEAAEKERDNANAAAAGIALQAETLQAERDALRARIEEMERQEPVGKIVAFGESLHEPSWRGGRLPPLMTELYALPGAKGEGK